MQENTNKIIIINTLVLYVRLALNAITTLLATRFALKALGVVDFGLYSVLGSIVSFMAIFNTIMLSTSNRFIAVAIGKGDSREINEQFNINLLIHIVIAVLTLVVALPIGDWYILRYVNYGGDINIALKVFQFSIIGSALSFVSVPYNGLLMAKEKFWVFCGTDIVVHILKMLLAFSLLYFFEEKLLVYSIGMAICISLPILVYYFYCKKIFPSIVKFRLSRNSAKYKEVFSFSGWVAYGAFAMVGQSQGASLLVNYFFNTVMNTALGIANQAYALVSTFASSITQPISPQITKNYASGNLERCYRLFIFSNKLSYLSMLFISFPFLIASEWILTLWLGTVPAFAVNFIILIIVDTLVQSMNSGISNLIFANGKIAMYQLVINTLRLSALFFGYVVLKTGAPAYALYFAYISISVFIFFAMQAILHKTIGFDNKLLWKKSYCPSLLVTVLFLPCCFLLSSIPSFLRIIVVAVYLVVLIYFIGLSKEEREYVKSKVIKTIK
jgi:O-antigen/teichoic acid export membrane protein